MAKQVTRFYLLERAEVVTIWGETIALQLQYDPSGTNTFMECQATLTKAKRVGCQSLLVGKYKYTNAERLAIIATWYPSEEEEL